MTERERTIYRDRIQRSGTGEELDRILNEHREQMKTRAKERGVTLSCDKPGEVRQIKATGAFKSEVGIPESSPSVAGVHAERAGGSEGG
jgi:hypothetical protein